MSQYRPLVLLLSVPLLAPSGLFRPVLWGVVTFVCIVGHWLHAHPHFLSSKHTYGISTFAFRAEVADADSLLPTFSLGPGLVEPYYDISLFFRMGTCCQ